MEITQNDLLTIIEQFSESVHKSFNQQGGNSEDIEKIIREFETNLKSSVKIVPGIQEDEQCQRIKSGIEEMEKKGREVKLELSMCRNEFRQAVFEAAQRELISMRPKIDLPDLPTQPEPFPSEFLKDLDDLRETEDSLIKELQDYKKNIKPQEEKIENIIMQSEQFFQNQH